MAGATVTQQNRFKQRGPVQVIYVIDIDACRYQQIDGIYMARSAAGISAEPPWITAALLSGFGITLM